jgi:hypothetical protein
MTTENDVGTAAAAAALFHLHSSPLVGPSFSFNMRMPSLSLTGQQAATIPTVAPDVRDSALSLAGIGRPRAASWDPTFNPLSLLGVLTSNGEPDTSAAGTLCALMKSDVYPVVNDSSGKSLRPRSMSTSAALSTQNHVRVDKGLRPRSTSVCSAAQVQNGSLKRARPRSYSTSSRASLRSAGSARRKRAQSLDSSASGVFNLDDPLSEDEGDEDSTEFLGSASLEDLRKIGQYSPNSRRKRIERFLDKRRRRIWRKRIKYDVRKNFADSRLRVKGRFVRKEDEEQLREYFQMI